MLVVTIVTNIGSNKTDWCLYAEVTMATGQCMLPMTTALITH